MPTVMLTLPAQSVSLISDEDAVRCENCDNQIGVQISAPNGRALLDVGDVRVWSLHGFCSGCGLEIHWQSSDRKLQSLLTH